jgi:Fe-S-cluster-containing hydrogenase component 2
MCPHIWIHRDYKKCSGCRKCEVACSLHHENKIWPEASRIRVFMFVPTLEVPHLCVQCHDYPCVESCPVNALDIDEETSAVIVDRDTCISCGNCVEACPGRIPFLHPGDNKSTICDLCSGDPQCVKICQQGLWDTLRTVPKTPTIDYKLYAKKPEEITKSLAKGVYGDTAKELW